MRKIILATSVISILQCHSLQAADIPTAVSAPAVNQAQTNTTTTAPTRIDCSYHIPATNNNIDDRTIKTWAQNAIVQAFSLNAAAIDQQMAELKSCFTDQGFAGYNDAMQKSGNINTIKTQQLTISSEAMPDLTLIPLKNNQWKVTLTLNVTYKNAKEKLMQPLSIELLIGRKMSGDLGIMQMIATAKQKAPDNTAAKTS